jgi:hypothetical protein
MTLTEKRDVNGYFAAKRNHLSRIHIVPTSQPDATGFSGIEPVVVEPIPADFNQDFTTDHSTPRKPQPSAGDAKAPPDPQASAALGRVRK